MISTPFKGATKATISQYQSAEHEALDMVSSYGTPLCAPEAGTIIRTVGDTYTPDDTSNLQRGYGIFMKGHETGYVHEYWHILPVVPVSVGQPVKRGQIIAFMGNAGTVRRKGVYVPLEDRLKPDKPGTHLHWEMFESYRSGKKGPHCEIMEFVDWDSEPQYTKFDLVLAISKVVAKTITLTR